MPRNDHGRGEWDLILKQDEDRPIYLTFDRARTKGPLRIQTTYSPNDPNATPELKEWYWQNGAGGLGAGTTIKLAAGTEDGGSEYGEFVWLRRKGVAQPAGALFEYTLPALTAALGSGAGFVGGAIYSGDLWLATLKRTAMRVTDCSVAGAVTEEDFGVGRITRDTAVFRGDGASKLYVSELVTGIRKYDGTTWTTGDSGTRRGQLEVVYWVPGAQSSTGGVGDAGTGAYSLVGTEITGTGFYHVQGDPNTGANWSTIIYAGQGTDLPIETSAASNTTVFFGTGLGVIGVNELGYAPNLTKWMESTASTANCTALVYWDGLIWGAHEQGLFVFEPDGTRIDTGTFLNFGAKTGTMPIFGRPQALSPGPDGLYVGYYNANNETSYIGYLCKDPDGTYRWSMAEAVIPDEVVTFVQQNTDTSGNPGLFIGTRGASAGELHLYRQYLPKWGDPETDALHGGPFQAAANWSLRLSRWSGGNGVPNAIRRLAVEMDYLGDSYPDNTVTLQMATDGGAMVTQGTATESPRWTGIPVTGSVRATSAQVKLSVSNAAANPVVINSASVQYTQRPERTEYRTYPLLIAEGTPGQDGRTIVSRLVLAQKEDPVSVQDEYGLTYDGLVEDFSVVAVEEDAGKPWKIQADLTISTTRKVTLYDSGAVYDSGAPYG